MTLPILHSARLLLRPWRNSDLAFFAKINADPQVMEFYTHTLSEKESFAVAEKIQKESYSRGYGFWAVEVPKVADFIGYIGLNYWNQVAPFAPCIDIGWRLNSAFWGQGFAIEGAKAVLEYGFEILKFPEIVSMATIGNIRSQRVMQRLGMITNPVENFDHPRLPKGHFLNPHVLYRLTYAEWAKLHA